MRGKGSRRGKGKNRRGRQGNRTLCMLLLTLLLSTVVLLSVNLSPSAPQSVEGSWAYDEILTIQFKNKRRGTLILSETVCPFSYTIENNMLRMVFDNVWIADAAYEFMLDGDTLTLIGGEGTTGGIYILTKVP